MNDLDQLYTDSIKAAVARALESLDAKEYHLVFLRLSDAAQAAVTMMSNHQFARGQDSVMDMWHPQKSPAPAEVAA